MALVDANYCFIYVDVGSNGRISDGGVFKECSLRKSIERNQVNMPEANPLPGKNKPVPYVMIGDKAFPLPIQRSR